MDVSAKLDVLLERTARMDEKQDAFKSSLDELKETLASHVNKDESRFAIIETDIAKWKGAVKLGGFLLGLIAIPQAWSYIIGYFSK